jgi:hypothetical protein
MKTLRRIAAPTYALAAIFVFFTGLELLQATWPPKIGEVAWRVVAIGLVSRTLLTPLLGLLLAFAVALFLEQRRVLRGLAIANGALAALLLIAMAVFALDALQMRTQIGPLSRQMYQVSVGLSLVKLSITLAFLTGMALIQWRAAAALERGAQHAASPESPVVWRASGRFTPPAPFDAQSAISNQPANEE